MTIRTSLAALGILATLAVALNVMASECPPVNGQTECPAQARSTDGGANHNGEAAKKGYTWEELTEAIPQLSKFELHVDHSTDGGTSDAQDTYLLCQNVRMPGSRIKQRSCMPLVEYLTYITGAGQLTNDQRYLALDILNQRTSAPISSMSPGVGSSLNN